ncbi:MAG TPA: MarR family transcriptional regulator [Solirubrobacteraceae bacterium]|jgi:DNA-binding MarR family transcriptional regulator
MLDKPESPSLLALANQLMSIVVLPYFGAEAARAELRRAPDARPAKPRASRVPPQDLQMRLTYRTVRVLHAIDSHPGASNRQVAQASGVADQGQISKLLRRLQRLGLIENIGDGQSKGAPNAWTLTSRGLALRQALIAGVGLERQ